MESSFNREQFGKLKSEEAKSEFMDGAHEEGLTLNARIDELSTKKAEIEEELISIRGNRGFESTESERMAVSLFTDAVEHESEGAMDSVMRNYGEYFDIDKYPKAYSTFIKIALRNFLGRGRNFRSDYKADPEGAAWLIKLMDLFPKDEDLFLSKAQHVYLSGNAYADAAKEVLLRKTGVPEEELRKSLVSDPETLDSFTSALYAGKHGIKRIKYLMGLYPENQEIFTKAAFRNFEERIKSGEVIDEDTLAEFPTFKETPAYQDMLPNVAEEIKELLSPKDGHTAAGYRLSAWSNMSQIIFKLKSLLELYPELDVKEIAPHIQKAHDELNSGEHAEFYSKQGYREIMLGICKQYNIELNT